MARIRTLKPEFWNDEKLAPLADHVRLVFLGLLSMSDDLGRIVDNERGIDAFVFSGFPDGRSRDTREALATLTRLGRVQRGLTASGQSIIQVVNWKRHQRVDRPSLKSCLPEIVTPHAVALPRETLATDSRNPRAPTYDLGPTTNDQRSPTDDRDRERPALPEPVEISPPGDADRTARQAVLDRVARERQPVPLKRVTVGAGA